MQLLPPLFLGTHASEEEVSFHELLKVTELRDAEPAATVL
jgi:hypothetical protein